MEINKIYQGDCLEVLKTFPDNSVDACITDPPYELGFMGKSWDNTGIANSIEMWKECLRVLKAGAYLLSFGGTRTCHRMTCAIEDAGFEIRDMIAWVYGSGFPKSLNIGKAVDKSQGNERVVVRKYQHPDGNKRSCKLGQNENCYGKYGAIDFEHPIDKGTSEWEGWGTALKPALEPITVARKPLSEKTVAENCLKWGVGGINIDGSRIPTEDKTGREVYQTQSWKNTSKAGVGSVNDDWKMGRFPANLIHDGSDEVVSLFPNTKSTIRIDNQQKVGEKLGLFEGGWKEKGNDRGHNDSGSASRFFYCAKASKSERNEGCEELEEKQYSHDGREKEIENAFQRNKSVSSNNHPTVKPIALMEYLVKLVSREGAVVLDPFVGSGSTLIACVKLGRNFVGIEKEPEYIKIANARIKPFLEQDKLK